jgi:malonate-semialdehyde dehydrogenase (acetylating) / methylmalonate-semialdehyde dehydrogenase
VRLLIGGEFVESRADEHVDVTNPVSPASLPIFFFLISGWSNLERSTVDVWGLSQATQEVVSRIPLTTADEFKAAVDAARTAFPGWRNTPVTTRQRVMFKFQELIRANMVNIPCSITVLIVSFWCYLVLVLVTAVASWLQDKLAENITTEQGKTLKDAWGDVFRGLG